MVIVCADTFSFPNLTYFKHVERGIVWSSTDIKMVTIEFFAWYKLWAFFYSEFINELSTFAIYFSSIKDMDLMKPLKHGYFHWAMPIICNVAIL